MDARDEGLACLSAVLAVNVENWGLGCDCVKSRSDAHCAFTRKREKRENASVEGGGCNGYRYIYYVQLKAQHRDSRFDGLKD